MKKFIFYLLGILSTFNLWSQNPNEHYAIIQKVNGNLIKNTEVDLKISVFQNLTDISPTYIEKQSLATNDCGVVVIELFADKTSVESLNTNNDCQTYFIKIETKPEFIASVLFKTRKSDINNENFHYIETDPFFNKSVASKISESDTNRWNNKLDSISEIDPIFNSSPASKIGSNDTVKWNNKQDRLMTGIGLELNKNIISVKNDFYLGQDTLGGIVFYIYTGNDGQQHGLIVSKIEGFELTWQDSCTLTKGSRSWDGNYNTNLMVNSPAKDWINDNFTPEWYLPSVDELNKLWDNRIHVNETLNRIKQPLLNTEGYWSSTELNEKRALTNSIFYGIGDIGKTNIYFARAIRKF